MRVVGSGPVPCSVMLIGEAPGRDEEISGRCFVGKSGQELSRILERNGLNRRDLYITNLVKERPPYINGKQHPPSKEDIKRDEKELIDEICRVRPLYIGAVGRVASRYFVGDHIDMEAGHALPFELNERVKELLRNTSGNVYLSDSHSDSLCIPSNVPDMLSDGRIGWVEGNQSRSIPSWINDCRVVPLYHPAAGLHNADLAPFVWYDIQQFAAYINGTLPARTPVEEHPNPDYKRGLDDFPTNASVVACDTEGLPGRVWGGSLSDHAGYARVFPVSSAPEVREIFTTADKIVFQNALHDVPILSELGIEVDWEKVEDTFLMAYCLRLVPLGLKQLSRRYCGMSMQSYLDVVAPADRKLALEWVERAVSFKPCVVCEGTGKVKERTKKGDRYKKNPVPCVFKNELGEKCSDGSLWVEREDQLKYDWDKGEWKLSKGWSVGKYLKSLRGDLESGKYEIEDTETGDVPNVRTRVGNWPDDVLGIISGQIGDLAEPSLDDIDPDAATYYSARDADATIRVYPILSEQIDALGLRSAYRLDLSVIPVAAEMQKNGMYIDRDYFRKFGKELENDNQITLAKLEALVGRPINPASGDHVAALLFGDKKLDWTEDDNRDFLSFDLDVEKWTKSGSRASTNDKVLEAIKLKYATNKPLIEIVDHVLDYRVRDKILGTYVRKMPLICDANGYVHTTIKPCRTATFRWASSDPNLQNIPSRAKGSTDLGKLVRKGFVAPPGYILGSWDFDQIEMRVLAWYSQDANLLGLFEGMRTCPIFINKKECPCHDIHRLTASLVFRVPADKVTKDQRTSAKNIGFGVVYGVTARGLQAQMELRGLHWTLEECQQLIDMYLYEAYPGVGRFMMDAHAEARRTGMVRSLFGHIRYCPGVHSAISSVREEALRQAANFKIQCTAAELLKVAMRNIWVDYKDVLDEIGTKLMMAVHDEILAMVKDNDEARAVTDSVITAAMTNPVPLDGVYVGTTGKFDYSWDKLK